MTTGWLARLVRGATWLGLANGLGLAAAFGAAILLAALVRYELQFNAAIDPQGTAVEIVTRISQPGRPTVTMAGTTGDLAAGLRAAYPGLRIGRMFNRPEPQKIAIDGQDSFERVVEADTEIIGILTLDVRAGDLRAALARPDGLILTTRAALRLFGRQDVLGRQMSVDGQSYQVTALIQPPSRNTRLADLDIMVSSRGAWTTLGQADAPGGAATAFVIGSAKTYAALDGNADVSPTDLIRTSDALAAAAFGRMIASNPGSKAAPPAIAHQLVGLRDIDGARRAGLPPDPNRADAVMLASMTGLALLVVLVAGLNYVNLATSRASSRALEIAVRKAFGATRRSLVASLLGESIAVASGAALLGLVMAMALEGWFSSLVQRPLDLALDGGFLALVAAAAVLTGLLAGAYPATVLSAFRPSLVLGARGAESPGAGILRKGLVALQVAASVAAIALSGTVQLQLTYLTGAALGFDDHDVLVYRTPVPLSSSDQRLETILTQMRTVPGVAFAAAADAIPTEGQVNRLTATGPSSSPLDLTADGITAGYFSALGIQVIAGRPFDTRETGGSGSVAPNALRPVVLTRKATASLGYQTPDDALGAIISIGGSSPWQGQVIGVVRDHPLPRLRDAAPDAIYLPGARSSRFLAIRLAPARGEGVEAALDDVVRTFFPDRPADRFALSDRVDAAHRDMSRLFGLAAFFAILSAGAALLGVLGMSAAMARHFRREAAVRKAFGAPSISIAALLARRLCVPVLIGMAAGAAVAALLGQRWLSGFPRQVESGGLPELAACAIVASLALAVSAWQTARLARTRPSDILGYE